MKPWIVGVIVVAIIGVVGYAFMQAQKPKMTSLPDGTVVYDVRTSDEYATSHISNAKSLPVESIQAGQLPAESKSSSIAVYCQSGRRSAAAASALKKAGYTNVIDMGGMQAAASTFGLSIVK